MTRLIDADTLEYGSASTGEYVFEYVPKYQIDNAPTIDAVPVVRCKDCKFAHMTYGGECKYCDAWESEESLYLDGDFFCAFGERKDEEADK